MKRLSPSSPPHSAGISVTDFTLHKDIGLLLSFTAKLLEIRWPTLSAPLRIRLHGAHMVLENTSITKVGLLYCGPSSQAAGGHLWIKSGCKVYREAKDPIYSGQCNGATHGSGNEGKGCAQELITCCGALMQPVPLDQFFHEQAVAAKLLREKQLKAIEDVLWSPSANMQHGGALRWLPWPLGCLCAGVPPCDQPGHAGRGADSSALLLAGTWLSRFVNTWTQWALYNIILLVMSLLNVHITNFEVQYRQQGDPGPKGATPPLACAHPLVHPCLQPPRGLLSADVMQACGSREAGTA